MNIIKKILPFLILLVLSYLAIQPFFIPGFFPIHDDTQVQRVYEMQKSLSDGMFPVRLVADLGYGYGYPIFNFYAPFSYYVGAAFMNTGMDALIATKAMMVLGVLLAGIFMYLLAREFWGEAGGLIAGVLYLYAPYHAVNIFVRGAVAELWGYAFIPLAFLGVYKVFRHCKQSEAILMTRGLWLWIAVGAVGYAGVILSHNLSGMMVTPFLFLFTLILFFFAWRKKMKRPYILFLSFLIGLLLSAFYWLPTLQEMRYTNVTSVIGGQSDYHLHFVCPQQLWDSPWGFGGSTSGCLDGLSFKIGKLHLLLVVASLIVLLALFSKWKKDTLKVALVVFFFFSALLSIFLTLESSRFIWDSFSQMAFFQFPWRFLIMVVFFSSLLGGAGIWIIKQFFTFRFGKYIFYLLVSVILIGIIFVNAEMFVPQTILPKTPHDYINSYHLTWTTSKISDEYLPKNFAKPKRSQQIPKEKIVIKVKDPDILITNQQAKTQEISAVITTPKEVTIHLNTAYFPAWHVYLNNKEVPYQVGPDGLDIQVPVGKYQLMAKFIQTPIEVLGNILSLTGVLILILGIIITRKEHKHAKKST